MEGKKRVEDRSAGGFTLVEMVVVLLIIALVSHLAVRELGRLRDHKLMQVADHQLEEIRASVFDAGVSGEPTGFLADVGRLPAATNAAQATLGELWAQPAHVRSYRLANAGVRENFVSESLYNRLNATHRMTNVWVATGWRGPYLRLPLGKTRLYDPWGNRLENPDDAGLARLTVTNRQIVAVSHYGPIAMDLPHAKRTLSLIPDGGAASSLKVHVVSTGGSQAGTVEYRWFGPCDGLITGAVQRADIATPAVFEGLTPGRRMVWDDVSKIARCVLIRPGDNYVEITVP